MTTGGGGPVLGLARLLWRLRIKAAGRSEGGGVPALGTAAAESRPLECGPHHHLRRGSGPARAAGLSSGGEGSSRPGGGGRRRASGAGRGRPGWLLIGGCRSGGYRGTWSRQRLVGGQAGQVGAGLPLGGAGRGVVGMGGAAAICPAPPRRTRVRIRRRTAPRLLRWRPGAGWPADATAAAAVVVAGI